MPRTLVLILLLLAVEFDGVVAGNAVSQANSKHACLVTTTKDSSYMMAVERITSVPMVKTWSASLTAQSRMAVGGHVFDKTEFIKGNCYWSISLYESSPIQLRLWKVFRVDIERKNIFIMNDEGDYFPIY